MANFYLKKWLRYFSALIPLSVATTSYASTSSSLPFASSLSTLKDAISGPVLLSASIIMIVVTCLMLAFGEWGSGFKTLINIVFWLSVAFGAASFVSTMFGSGAVF
jgi:type IV secretory pathway VirB2 component (pilin)